MDIVRASTPPPPAATIVQENTKKVYYKSPINYDSTANATILLKSRTTYRETTPAITNMQQQQKACLKTQFYNNNSNNTLDINNNSFNDELESPLKIKENIQTSIQNLKFDLLRSSTSDDDEINNNNNFFELNDRKVPQKPQQSKLSTTPVVQNSNTTAINTPTLTKTVNSINRHNYVRTPPYRSAYYMPNINNNNNNTTTTTNTLVTPVSNNLLRQNSLKFNGKRGKEEALSNSSSSDEEELHNNNNNQQPSSSSHKLQQLLLNPAITVSSGLTPSATTTSNTNITPVVHAQLSSLPLKISMNTNSLNFNNNLRQQSCNITPIASSNLHITTVVNHSSTSATTTTTTPVSNNLTLDTSKIDNEFDSSSASSNSKSSANYSPSTASSIASYSPIHSVTSPVSNNSETIDFQDDSSSTASGPIYIRQPGFDHHAHEVTITPQQKPVSRQNSEIKLTKISKKTESTAKGPADSLMNKSSKAKKKLCIMTSNNSIAPQQASTSTVNQLPAANQNNIDANQNIQLKPIKQKRDPLPMRLRALPPSFWQQPNQSNVSPGSMYLPPLFKHDSDDEDEYKMTFEHSTNKQTKDVKMSPANTDLLFKLFDNIEHKDRKLQQIQLHRKLKPNRKAPLKGLSKQLIKGEDPCILDAVAEGLFPLLTLDSRNETVQYITFKADNLTSNGLSNSSPMLSSTSSAATAVVCTSNTNNNMSASNTNLLPLLQIEQNYSQALSEVVAAL